MARNGGPTTTPCDVSHSALGDSLIEIQVTGLPNGRSAIRLVRQRGVVIPHHGRAVLCIGNDPIHLNLRCALLAERGWHVSSAGSGHEGVIRFGHVQVDAVVLDLNDDGVECALIAGELKRLRPELPIIMMVTPGNMLAEGATAQADALVAKTEEIDSLLAALNRILRAA